MNHANSLLPLSSQRSSIMHANGNEAIHWFGSIEACRGVKGHPRESFLRGKLGYQESERDVSAHGG